MITNFDNLADRLKGIKLNGEDVTPEKFIDAIKSEDEHEIEVSESLFMSNEQLDELKSNVKKTGYEEGKTAGQEMTIKDLKRKFGIEKEGKSVDTLYKYATEKVLSEAGKETEPKIQELQSSLESLQNKYQTDLSEKEQIINSLNGKIKSTSINSLLSQSTPKNLNGIKPNQAAALFRMEYDLDFDDNSNVVVKKGGAIMKDQLEKPLPYNDVFNDFLNSNGWLGSNGRGGGNSLGGNSSEFKNINDVFKHLEKNNINPDSNQGLEMINKFKQSQE